MITTKIDALIKKNRNEIFILTVFSNVDYMLNRIETFEKNTYLKRAFRNLELQKNQIIIISNPKLKEIYLNIKQRYDRL